MQTMTDQQIDALVMAIGVLMATSLGVPPPPIRARELADDLAVAFSAAIEASLKKHPPAAIDA